MHILPPYICQFVSSTQLIHRTQTLREATASDLLSLEEEYENQQSWRAAHDKLTFIVCEPAAAAVAPSSGVIHAGEDDAPPRMVGDVNLFLTPLDDDDGSVNGDDKQEKDDTRYLQGEIDIMIAAPEHRRKGRGEAAVRAFLRYLGARHGDIVGEYVSAAAAAGTINTARIKRLVAKIHADNAGSIRLFGNLGFRRDGDPDYFNEISMALDFSLTAGIGDEGVGSEADGLGYRECIYDRSLLDK
ncbi:acetyltransferase domain-containing protein [Xylaria cf. heliscus]|nr:acetyltransferase domain-containing protein [Xylaria cf. heliscus]